MSVFFCSSSWVPDGQPTVTFVEYRQDTMDVMEAKASLEPPVEYLWTDIYYKGTEPRS